MANLVQPKGFVPSRYANSAPYNGASNLYCIPAADASQYGVGDAVKALAGGDLNGVPYLQKAAGTDTVRGVIVGIMPVGYNTPSLVGTNVDLTIQSIPATKAKDYYVMVADDPDLLFEVMGDATALTSAACNKNASFTVTNPTAPAQNSASVLTGASVAVTATLNLRIMGLIQKQNNNYGANALWLVKFNLHDLMGGTVGV